jgi:diaminopimelate decarboxylase
MINRLDGPLLSAFWALLPVLRLLGDNVRYRAISRGLKMFSKSPNRKLVPGIEAYAEAITSEFRKQFSEHGIPVRGMHLQIEPGRSIYGNAGVHLSSVLKTKTQSRPISWNWVLLDTTYFYLTGGVFEYNLHDFVVANHTDRPAEIHTDVVGRSCYADRILPEVRFPRVDPGDLVAFLDMGAYQEVSACNFNALPRPGTVLVKGDKAEWIRLPETNKDVFRRDVVPERFKTKKTNRRSRQRPPGAPARSRRRGTRR